VVGLVLGAAVVLQGAAQTVQQLEVRPGYALGEDRYGSGRFSSGEPYGYGSYLGSFSLAPQLQLFVKENFDGSFALGKQGEREEVDATTSATLRPFSERNLPVTNDVVAGLQWIDKVRIELSYRLNSFSGARPLSVNAVESVEPYFDLPAADYNSASEADWNFIYQRQRFANHYARLFVSAPLGPLSIESASQLVVGRSALSKQLFSAASNAYDSLQWSHAEADSDIWNSVEALWHSPTGIAFGIASLMKVNLAGHGAYNFYRYDVLSGGEHALASGSTQLSWALNARWFEDAAMAQRGYATGLLLDGGVRTVWSFAPLWYVKGTVGVHAGLQGMLKGRNEASVRKAFRKGSSVEGGYFGTWGGLFPTQGPYLRLIAVPWEALRLSAEAKAIYEGPDMHLESSSSIKSQVSGEVGWALRRQLEVVVGSQWVMYNQEALGDFAPSRGIFHTGLRWWYP
jgi:hypothetical protein